MTNNIYVNKLISLSTKKGRKIYARKQVSMALQIIRQQFGLSIELSLRIATILMSPLIRLQKIQRGSHEVIYPKILHINVQIKHALRSITSLAFSNIKNYNGGYSEALAYSILQHCFYETNQIQKHILDVNKLAYKNKYRLLQPFKSKRKFMRNYRLLRLMKHPRRDEH